MDKDKRVFLSCSLALLATVLYGCNSSRDRSGAQPSPAAAIGNPHWFYVIIEKWPEGASVEAVSLGTEDDHQFFEKSLLGKEERSVSCHSQHDKSLKFVVELWRDRQTAAPKSLGRAETNLPCEAEQLRTVVRPEFALNDNGTFDVTIASEVVDASDL